MTDVRIFTTRVCPYCIAAKRLLTSLGVPFDEVALDAKPELRQQLSEENGGWKTVPMVFVGDRFVGGFTELRQIEQSGELFTLLHRPHAATG